MTNLQPLAASLSSMINTMGLACFYFLSPSYRLERSEKRLEESKIDGTQWRTHIGGKKQCVNPGSCLANSHCNPHCAPACSLLIRGFLWHSAIVRGKMGIPKARWHYTERKAALQPLSKSWFLCSPLLSLSQTFPPSQAATTRIASCFCQGQLAFL